MLFNKEVIYREIIEEALKRNVSFTQLAIAKKFKFSLSTVNNALRPLVEIGAITKRHLGFDIIDVKKLLLYWSSTRKLSKDIIYKTRAELPVIKIEASLPNGCIYAAFSAYRFLYNDAPADYSEVYAYADSSLLKEIKKRFPQSKGPENLIVLEPDKFLNEKMPVSQIYVDLWNIKEWYARDFINALDKRLRL